MRKSTKLGLVIAGVVAAAGISLASGTGWLGYFGEGDGHRFTVEHNDGAHTLLQVDKHPKDSSMGTIPLDIQLTIDAVGVLNSMVLQVADDTDSSGYIEEPEWTTVATATITVAGGKTTAVIPTYALPGAKHAVRVLMDRQDIGLTWDMVAQNGVQVDITQY